MCHTRYAYARRGLSDPSLAEEAVQDSFRGACEREDKLFASDNPEGWLMNVLKNVIRSTRRERARLAETVLEGLGVQLLPAQFFRYFRGTAHS